MTTPALDPDHHFSNDEPAEGQVFGVIGAWDGHRVGRGRVVVDSTWHHFFEINLSGDRHLEDNDLPAQHRQKQFGFYVEAEGGSRVPNAAYRSIKAYFRNLVYWLIPAGRRGLIFWRSLDKIVRRPQIREELAGLTASGRLGLEHFLHFGQLAERYFAQARGACATLEFLLKVPPDLDFPLRRVLELNLDAWDPKWKLAAAFAEAQRHAFGELRKLLAAGADVQPGLARALSDSAR